MMHYDLPMVVQLESEWDSNSGLDCCCSAALYGLGETVTNTAILTTWVISKLDLRFN